MPTMVAVVGGVVICSGPTPRAVSMVPAPRFVVTVTSRNPGAADPLTARLTSMRVDEITLCETTVTPLPPTLTVLEPWKFVLPSGELDSDGPVLRNGRRGDQHDRRQRLGEHHVGGQIDVSGLAVSGRRLALGMATNTPFVSSGQRRERRDASFRSRGPTPSQARPPSTRANRPTAAFWPGRVVVGRQPRLEGAPLSSHPYALGRYRLM